MAHVRPQLTPGPDHPIAVELLGIPGWELVMHRRFCRLRNHDRA